MAVIQAEPVSTDLMDAVDEEPSKIAQFFDKRSVFITGAAGFVGAVLLETLLRCYPGIENIYILLREKKGVPASERKGQIFKKKIFHHISTNNPSVFDKVKVVKGDVTSPYLGIDEDDLDEMQDKVSVVFHCAAVISFKKPLRYMLIQNLVGANNVVQFCKRLTDIKVLVHTSTAYSNCNRRNVEIEEAVYKLKVTAKEFLEALDSNVPDEVLDRMQDQCTPNWPNTYTFTKALAEDLMADYANDLPVAIVRPSIIFSSWKGILPGYTEEGAGIIDVSIGIGKGFIRVLYCDENKLVDIVPVDVVTNSLIISSYGIGEGKFKSPFVVNCCATPFSPCTWGHFIRTLYQMQETYPLPKMYQKPYLVMRKHKITYWASAFVNHYAPAICIDIILAILNKKPRLTKLYRFYDLALEYLKFFLTNEWRFESGNMRKLNSILNVTDAEMVPVDLEDASIDNLCTNIKSGAPFYAWEIDKKPLEKRIPIAYKRALLTNFIKWMVILWFFMLLLFLFTRSFPRNSIF